MAAEMAVGVVINLCSSIGGFRGPENPGRQFPIVRSTDEWKGNGNIAVPVSAASSLTFLSRSILHEDLKNVYTRALPACIKEAPNSGP
eukprot:804681-Pelagomonas_calceolata.AAC.3